MKELSDKDKIEKFLKYIYQNNITAVIDYDDTERERKILNEFIAILKEKAGDEYSCIIDKKHENILIYNEQKREYIGYIYATVNYGFIRGDVWDTLLYIQYAVIDIYVYIGGEYAGYIYRPEQIDYREDGIYLIDLGSESLKKYVNYKLQWKTKIAEMCVQTCTIEYSCGCPTELYHPNMMGIRDLGEVGYYSRDTGEFFGIAQIKEQYDKIDLEENDI